MRWRGEEGIVCLGRGNRIEEGLEVKSSIQPFIYDL
jgi:hypothetical protein